MVQPPESIRRCGTIYAGTDRVTVGRQTKRFGQSRDQESASELAGPPGRSDI